MILKKYRIYGAYTIKGVLKVTRIHNLIYIAFTQLLVAIFISNLPSQWATTVADPFLLIIIVSTAFIVAAGYTINDYYDVKVDYINKPEKVVVGRYLKRRIALAIHSLFSFIGISLGFLVHWKIGLFNLGCAFLLWLYSNHLKRRPLIGNITIALLTSASLLVIAFYYQSNKEIIYMYSLFAFSISLIREIIKDMEDLKGDIDFGSKTLPIIWGIRKTKIFIYILTTLFSLGYIYIIITLDHPVLTSFFGILVIPIIYFIFRLYRADTKKQYNVLSDFCKLIMFSGVVSMMFY